MSYIDCASVSCLDPPVGYLGGGGVHVRCSRSQEIPFSELYPPPPPQKSSCSGFLPFRTLSLILYCVKSQSSATYAFCTRPDARCAVLTDNAVQLSRDGRARPGDGMMMIGTENR
ncbi:hypothetical protein J6590_004255 [Homalodisca vitripennis]|nr:hypothetical protein J6590_004255 [Homalodisca vitripennis]